MTWQPIPHDPSHFHKLEVFLYASNPMKYFEHSLYSCGYDCEEQAAYRLGTHYLGLLGRSQMQGYKWMSTGELQRVKKRAQRSNKVWIAIRLGSMRDVFWVGDAGLTDELEGVELTPKDTLIHIAQTTVPSGIARITKSQLLKSDPVGHTPLNLPPGSSKSDVDRLLRRVGLRHGRVLNPRPVEVIIRDVEEALGRVGVGFP